jgi:mono/diheme cytochrome c family protein
MKRLFQKPVRFLKYFILIALSLMIVAIVTLWAGSSTVYALPEYASRTGEPCAACHVSAGGGGPRTLRGLLWSARGRPDKVPDLPGMLIAPRVTDGMELYQIACAGCHGTKGEGLFAMGLVNTKISPSSIRAYTLVGIPKLGMPSFQGQFTPDQLNSLVKYVAGLSTGEIPPPVDAYPLPPAHFHCISGSAEPDCSISAQESGGN